MSMPLPEDRLTQQERANFLEDYIRAVTEEMDDLMNGRNYEAELKALKFRIAMLQRSGNPEFDDRVRELQTRLNDVETEYASIRPRLDALETERRYYRSQTSGF